MKFNKIILFSFKQNFLTILFTLFLIFLILFSKSNIFAAQNALTLWAQNVIPTLFPFFIATELLNYTNLPYYLGKLTNKFMKPLFNIPGEGSYAFIMGILSGYPIGAKIVNNLLENNICTKSEAERMLAFTNNSGPLFIIGTIGITLFNNIHIGIVLFITHILSCLTIGLLFGFLSKKHFFKNSQSENRTYSSKTPNISDLGTIISTSITNSISTILLIGGFIVLFSIIISIINNLNIITYISNFLNIPHDYTNCIIIGLLELTNGVNAVSLIHTKHLSIQIIITAFLLGFAGISIFLQIFSIASKHKLSIKPYLIGKLLQGCFAALYTYILIHNFSFLQLDILPI